ncbi:MAG: sigma 54-interacting transcriptional regulator [bacterium]|nr:MAG: sigma 54-interacting transcriptional regulator [bacterium]
MVINQETFKALQEENERLRHIVDELTILNDLSRAMSSTIEVKDIMANFITKSIQTIGVEQGTIMLLEEDSEVPLRTMIRGIGEKRRGKLYTLGNLLTGWMIQNRKPLLANDIAQDKRFRGLEVDKSGVHSILSVPMILRGKLIGVINLFNKKEGTKFTEDDQKLLCIIATQVASFLANARFCEMVLESRDQLQKQTTYLQKEVAARYGFEGIIGSSRKIKEIQEEIKSIADTPASVLIIGETGTGKELVAKTIHYNSDRKDKTFVDVNSAAVPENLVESEFFGIEDGVATGVKKRIGLFEQANGGTLFIDEIGDMSLASQAKILRVLEERQIRRVGSNRNINVDIRLIAATNKNLLEEIDRGTFREDLYYRLSVFEINIPPLRVRREDIPFLIEHFIRKYADQMGKIIEGLTTEASEILINYDWPGNVRELANVVERAVIITKCPTIGVENLPSDFRKEFVSLIPTGETFEEAVNNFKKRIILKSLRETGNNKAEAARNLKISRAYLFRLLNQLGIKQDIDHV